jgi:FkbM family methyltransferase
MAIIKNPRFSTYIRYSLSENGILFFRDFKGHSLIFHPHDIIGRFLLETGEYSRKSVLDIATIIPRMKQLKESEWVIEIGANIGTHSVYFCHEFGNASVLAIEADPENAHILECNIKINDLSERVRPVLSAVSNFDGEIQLVRDFYNRGGTSIHGDKLADRASVFAVPAMTVPSLIQKYEINPMNIALFWIDVEGHEFEVLEGIGDMILSQKPPLFMEYTPTTTARGGQIAEILYKYYDNVRIHDGTFSKISKEDFRKIKRQVDIYAD